MVESEGIEPSSYLCPCGRYKQSKPINPKRCPFSRRGHTGSFKSPRGVRPCDCVYQLRMEVRLPLVGTQRIEAFHDGLPLAHADDLATGHEEVNRVLVLLPLVDIDAVVAGDEGEALAEPRVESG